MSKHPRTACVVFMILLPLLLAGLLWLGRSRGPGMSIFWRVPPC